MPREAKAYLYDMRQATALIADFTTGLDYDAYAAADAYLIRRHPTARPR